MVIFICYVHIIKFWEHYNERIDAEFASITPELQASVLTDYLIKAGFVSTVGVCLNQFRNLVVRYYTCRVGNGMVKKTLNKVLLAPVNLFFDVTPVGKILKIFNEEVHTFREKLWEPLIHIIGMTSHVVVVLTTMFSIGGWETCITLCLMVFILSFIIPPFMIADK